MSPTLPDTVPDLPGTFGSGATTATVYQLLAAGGGNPYVAGALVVMDLLGFDPIEFVAGLFGDSGNTTKRIWSEANFSAATGRIGNSGGKGVDGSAGKALAAAVWEAMELAGVDDARGTYKVIAMHNPNADERTGECRFMLRSMETQPYTTRVCEAEFAAFIIAVLIFFGVSRAEATKTVAALEGTGAGAIPVALTNVNNIVNEVTNDFTANIRNNIRNEIIFDDSFISGLFGGVGDIVDSVNTVVKQVTDIYQATIGDLTRGLDPFADLLAMLVSRVGAIANVLNLSAPPNAPGSWPELIEHEKELGRELWDKVFGPTIDRALEAAGTDRDKVVEWLEGSPDMENICSAIFGAHTPQSQFARYAIDIALSLVAFAYLPVALITRKAEPCIREFNRGYPWKQLEIGDALKAYHARLLGPLEIQHIIRGEGYSAEDANRMVELSQQFPTVDELLILRNAGVLPQNILESVMRIFGYNDFFIKTISDYGIFRAPVQDLITMAVRDVFDPRIVQEYQLEADFPPEFARLAKEQGVSEEWARRYWGAHWGLPSVQMGYEMLHRGIINESQLKDLMKALDIMPGWRDKLIQISYAPFTRVDIRRMHQIGVLSDAEMMQAYKDIGYDSEKAAKLSEFTKELNKQDSALDVTDISELSRSNIMTFLNDGVIGDEAAFAMLLEIGYDALTAGLWIKDASLRREAEERKADADLIIERAKAGLISFNEANDELVTAGFSSAEVTKYKRRLLAAEVSTTKMPSKTDLDKMLARDIVTVATYRDSMRRLGYSEQWTERYIKLAQGDK